MLDPLLIFDSGIGGFSILRALRHSPIPLVYLADQRYFPYGDKDPAWVSQHLASYLPHLIARYHPRAILLACNTGTVTAITTLRRDLAIPIFGVEPVVKMLAPYPRGVIWGTPVTIRSPQLTHLLKTHGSHLRLYAPPHLASAIEDNNNALISEIIDQAKSELGDLDAIGLSCTHYPLILSRLQEAFSHATILEPSLAVAQHVYRTLALTPISSSIAPLTLVSSRDVLRLVRQAQDYDLV